MHACTIWLYLLQVPFYVHTRMLSSAVKAKLRPWFVATADEYTSTAARWIGTGPLCVPGAAQKLQWCLTGFVPDWVHDWYRIRLHLQHRAVLRGGGRRAVIANNAHPRGEQAGTPPNGNASVAVGPNISG
jgi:17beta-estradiol 17-dehydrogenase / very-long-chain 3-oxoacyl-CoA reductase